MRKKRVNVSARGGKLTLVRPKGEPVAVRNWRWWQTTLESTNAVHSNGTVYDQTDGPHTAGLTVVRRDSNGWYIRIAPCAGSAECYETVEEMLSLTADGTTVRRFTRAAAVKETS